LILPDTLTILVEGVGIVYQRRAAWKCVYRFEA
jgi:hypothetical protein